MKAVVDVKISDAAVRSILLLDLAEETAVKRIRWLL
jgi:hypothetical protein